MRAFADGWLDAAAQGIRIIDGNEGAYYHDETLKFFRGYDYIRGAAELVSPENRARYRGQVQVGNALYLVFVFGAWPEYDRGWEFSIRPANAGVWEPTTGYSSLNANVRVY